MRQRDGLDVRFLALYRGFRCKTDVGKKVVENRVSIPDFHAAVHCALGIDPANELHDGARPVPIADGGKPIRTLFT